MSYVELSDILFRGELRGARGLAKFKLTADAIDAVDTVNIAGNQVTYNFFSRYSSIAIAAGAVNFSMQFEVPDTWAYVEIVAYGEFASAVYVNGSLRPNRNLRAPSFIALPFVELIGLGRGVHTVSMIHSANGTSSSGYIACRYIRRTGLDNV